MTGSCVAMRHYFCLKIEARPKSRDFQEHKDVLKVLVILRDVVNIQASYE